LVDDPHAHQKPSSSQLKKWNEEQKESSRSQIAAVEAKSNTGSAKANTEDAQRKRREREERKRAQQTALQNAEDSLLAPSTSTIPTEPTLAPIAPTPKDPSQSSIPYTIVVPAPSSTLEWYDPLPKSYMTIEAARQAGIWDYPANLQERARCGVFRGLWDQGYYMGVGIRFGGEYLVYPGWFLSLLFGYRIAETYNFCLRKVTHCDIIHTLSQLSSKAQQRC
jgi:tRNA-splicing endonuclease subunit Sen34